jgi:hypothetical protein
MHAIQQDEKIRHLEQELKAARLEITKLKAVNGSSSSSSSVMWADINGWIKPENSKTGGCRFPAHDHPQLQLRNGFSVLETDTLEAVQKGPGLLKQKDGGVNAHVGKLERKKERKKEKKEKKDSIAWKQSWEGKGTNATRKPGLQI